MREVWGSAPGQGGRGSEQPGLAWKVSLQMAGRNEMMFKVPANPNRSVFPWLLQSVMAREGSMGSCVGKKKKTPTLCGVSPSLFSKGPLTSLRLVFYFIVHNSYEVFALFYLG